MASKRHRGESSRSSQSFDRKRFVSEAASDRYHKILAGKTLVPERGLRPDEIQDGEMAVMIAERNWFDFTSQPKPAVISVVKEFYANAKEAVNYVAQVRGKAVAYDRSTINAYYNLPDIEEDHYRIYSQERIDLANVIQRLCRPGTDWKLKDNSSEAISFSHAELSRYGKAWYSFLCANLMPTRHVSDVVKERAVLLYSIVRGRTVDVGRVIQDSITCTLKGSTSGGLPHPSLICGLCKRANVVWGADEILQSPMALIDHAMIARYKVWEGGISHPRGEGFIIFPTSPSAAGPLEFPQHTPSLVAAVHGLQRASRRQERRIDHMAQRMDSFMTYSAEFNTALASMFANCGFNTGLNPIQFPAPPIYPDYPPDSPDEEGDSDD